MSTLSNILNPPAYSPQPEEDVPSLSSRLNQAYVGGQLISTNTPGIQQLAQSAGVQVPNTPLAAGVLGATPKQQDMTGSPLQNQKALQLAAQPTQVLQVAQEQQTQPATRTAEQQKTVEKSQNLGTLSNVSERVSQLIQSKISNLASAGQAAPAAADQATIQTLAPGQVVDYTQLKTALSTLAGSPSDPRLIAQVNTLLGRDPSTPLTPAEISSMYQTAVQTIVASAGNQLPSNVSVADLIHIPGFGYDLPTLSNVLEVTPDQLSKMSLADMQAQISSLTSAQAAASQNQASSLLRGGAEQAGYLQASKQLDVSGVSEAEASLNNISQAVKSSQVVNFNGQPISVSDLLGDSGITRTISDYINSAPGSSTRAELDRNEPDLSKFINSNLAGLTQLTASMTAGVNKFNQMQSQVSNLSKVGNTQLSDSVMSQLVPNWGKFQTSSMDASQIPLLSQLSKLPQSQAEAIAGSLNQIALSYPDLAKQIGNLTPDELQAIADPSVFSKLSENTRELSEINLAIQTNDVGRALQLVTGQAGITQDQVLDQLRQDQSRAALGMPTSGLSDKIKLDFSGKLGSAKKILDDAGVTSGTKPVTNLADLSSGRVSTYSGSMPTEPSLTANQNDALNKLQSYITPTGLNISGSDLIKAGITPEDLDALKQTGFLDTLTDLVGSGTINTIRSAPAEAATKQLLAPYPDVSQDAVNSLSSAADLNSFMSKLDSSISSLSDAISSINKSGTAGQYNMDEINKQLNSFKFVKNLANAKRNALFSNSLPSGPSPSLSQKLGSANIQLPG